ncbi:hypothetical protein Trydic_g17797 [Trypoxylus dichotomus]
MIPRKVFKTIISRTMCKSSDNSSVRTAGIIIIGDEILKGDAVDTNSSFLVKKLYELGVRVKKISVIGDEVDEICTEVKSFSKNYTYVITSGGIGPTHDDVTFEAVAKAFDEPLVAHPVLVSLCSQYYETSDLNCPGMKLANIPKSAKLTFGEGKNKKGSRNYPNVSIKNVYMFPVVALNQLVKEFPNVVFGSYPVLENNTYKVKITIEATEDRLIQNAYEKMLQLLPKEYIVEF